MSEDGSRRTTRRHHRSWRDKGCDEAEPRVGTSVRNTFGGDQTLRCRNGHFPLESWGGRGQQREVPVRKILHLVWGPEVGGKDTETNPESQSGRHFSPVSSLLQISTETLHLCGIIDNLPTLSLALRSCFFSTIARLEVMVETPTSQNPLRQLTVFRLLSVVIQDGTLYFARIRTAWTSSLCLMVPSLPTH